MSHSYFYDGTGVSPNPNFANGLLTKVSSSVSSTEYSSFDNLGRVLAHKQITEAETYNTAYTYNLSGALIEETYPSGRKVQNTLDTDGDLSLVQTKTAAGAYQTRASDFVYTAHGAASSIKLGNNRFESTQFNTRLQPTEIGLGDSASNPNLLKIQNFYGELNNGAVDASKNNGNIGAQRLYIDGVWQHTQEYAYDSLNRIRSAKEVKNGTHWLQIFNYDRYGNRNFATGTTTIADCPVNQCNPTVNASNNRFNSGQGYSYDSSGNVIADAEGRSFIYDAENKQKEVKNSSGSVVGTYFFDGDGKRIKKVTASETTVFVYDAGGTLVAEYSTKTPQTTAATRYLTSDHLGSPRIITDATGNVISRRDFMPFGEEIKFGTGSRTEAQGYTFGDTAAKPGDSTTQKFTTYERDDETNLDFAQARMHNYNHGRFTSPDPYSIVFEMRFIKDISKAKLKLKRYIVLSQQWNRYSYALNNPMRYVDPNGEQIRLHGTEEEILEQLKRIFAVLGWERASYLQYRQTKQKDGSFILTLSIKSEDTRAFMAVGGNDSETQNFNRGFASILLTKENVRFHVSKTFAARGKNGKMYSGNSVLTAGGGVTLEPSESASGEFEIYVHPEIAKVANKKVLGSKKNLSGLTRDGSLLQFSDNSEADAHEFGHVSDKINDSMSAAGTLSDSLRFENLVRKRNGNKQVRIKERP